MFVLPVGKAVLAVTRRAVRDWANKVENRDGCQPVQEKTNQHNTQYLNEYTCNLHKYPFEAEAEHDYCWLDSAGKLLKLPKFDFANIELAVSTVSSVVREMGRLFHLTSGLNDAQA